MSKYYGDFLAGRVVRASFNTTGSTAAPGSLASGAVAVRKDGVDVTPSGGVTLTADASSVVGLNELVIDTSVDPATFAAGSDYSVRLSGSSNVGGTSVVGVVVCEFSIQHRPALLAAAGLDAVAVESGVNARQALSPILAAAAGVLSGAGTGTIVVKGGNVATTRITSTSDVLGNRLTSTLNLPA